MSIRYHFSNRSEDIIGLFTAALDALDIPWTRSTKYIVSIYRSGDYPPRLIYRPEGPRGTVDWCPLHGVGDQR
jgi:hypothetical protein